MSKTNNAKELISSCGWNLKKVYRKGCYTEYHITSNNIEMVLNTSTHKGETRKYLYVIGDCRNVKDTKDIKLYTQYSNTFSADGLTAILSDEQIMTILKLNK